MPSPILRLVCALLVVTAARSAGAASLNLASGTLQLEAVVGGGATASLSMAGGTITITASEPIALGSLAGWSGDGTTTVSGPASVMTGGFFVLGFASLGFASDFATPGGTMIINPPVVISANVHLTAAGGIALGGLDSSSDGSYDFVAEVTGAGNITLNGNVGAVARPATLSFSVGAGGFIASTTTISSTGAQLYLGTLLLQTATTLTGSGITLNDVAASNSGIITLHGDTTIDGNLGSAASSLTSVTVASGTTTFAGGAARTSGAQSYGNIVLAADTTLTAATVHLQGTVDGAHAFTIAGDVLLSGSLGGTTALSSLAISGVTTVTNAANAIVVATTGDQLYAGAVMLQADVSASCANFTHDATIDGAHALTISAATHYQASGAIGSVTPLTAFAVHGPATWAGGTLTTTASAHFYDALMLASGFTITSAQVTFDGTIDGALPLTATGTTTFGGIVGGATPLAALTVDGATHLVAASVDNIGAQQYLGPLVVSAAATALSTGSFAITFGGAIDRANGGPLALATTTHTGIVFATGATCDFVLAGTTAGSEYTQLTADGAVTLNGCTLHATSTAAAPFAAGTSFLVIAAQPVNGTFAGLAQDAHTTIGGQDFTVDYAHGGVRLVAQASTDLGAPPADLATTTADLATTAPTDLASGADDLAAPADAAGGSRHGGCAYAPDDRSPNAAAVIALLFLLVRAAIRLRARRYPTPRPSDGS